MSQPTANTQTLLDEIAKLTEKPADQRARRESLKAENRKAEADIRARMDDLATRKDTHRAAGRKLDENGDALAKELRENNAIYRALQ